MPRLRLAFTAPSYACTRLRSPSTTLTFTITVSPAENSGSLRPMRLISSSSSFWIRFIALLLVQFLLEFIEQLAFDLAHPAPLQQLRPSQPSAPQRLLQPPALDLRMVPREQYRRHRFPLVRFRPRVLRVVEQPVHERVLLGRHPVPERSGQ